MKTAIKLRDDNGRIIGTARREEDKTLHEIIGDMLIAAGLAWIAVGLVGLAATLIQMWI